LTIVFAVAFAARKVVAVFVSRFDAYSLATPLWPSEVTRGSCRCLAPPVRGRRAS